MRCFIAIKLPQEVKDEVIRIQNALRPLDLHAKWVEPENLHVTLKFLGDIRPQDLDKTKEIVASISSFARGFLLKLADIGAFPDLKQTRVLWAGIQPMANPVVIIEYLEGPFLKLAVPAEKRTPHPHITLARIKSPKNMQGLEAKVRSLRLEEREWEVGGVSLFKSTLNPAGPVYEEILEAKLEP